MADLTNKLDKEELLNQVKAYLTSTELCNSVFMKNQKYTPYCEAQQNSGAAQVPKLIKNQIETLSSTAKAFLTTSYSAERANSMRRKP